MNEKHKETYKFQQPATGQQLNWNQLPLMVSSLENRARLCGEYAIAHQLELMRKSMARSSVNKKLARSIQAKYERLYAELCNNGNSR